MRQDAGGARGSLSLIIIEADPMFLRPVIRMHAFKPVNERQLSGNRGQIINVGAVSDMRQWV